MDGRFAKVTGAAINVFAEIAKGGRGSTMIRSFLFQDTENEAGKCATG